MRYVLGAIGLVILAIIAIIFISNRGPSPTGSEQSGKKKVTLSDYAKKGGEARFTTDGPINAKEKHRMIQITVTRSERKIDIFKGYNFEIERSQRFDNDESAYNDFIHALQNAGYANENTKAARKDETGVCPLGNRYTYELLDNNEEVLKLWSSSCFAREGTFAGNAGLVRTLFQAQIPDYTKLTQGVQLQ